MHKRWTSLNCFVCSHVMPNAVLEAEYHQRNSRRNFCWAEWSSGSSLPSLDKYLKEWVPPDDGSTINGQENLGESGWGQGRFGLPAPSMSESFQLHLKGRGLLKPWLSSPDFLGSSRFYLWPAGGAEPSVLLVHCCRLLKGA